MQTIREFCSTVRGHLNSSSDDYIPYEMIYWVGINISSLFIKRDADNRKLFKNTSLFKKLECVELEPYEEGCIQLGGCSNMMRSVKPLPTFYQSNFGSLIKVYNLSNDVDYIEISVNKYKNIKNLPFKPRKTKYYWIEDNYLILPDSEVERVNVFGMFTDPTIISDTNLSNNSCSILEQPFPCVDYLIGAVVEATVKQLSIMKNIPKDETINLNSNEK